MGTTLETLRLRPGSWRASTSSQRYLDCKEAAWCQGGAIVNGTTNSQCAPHSVGPECSQCEDEYFHSGPDDACVPCSEEAGVKVTFAYVALVLVLVVVLAAVGRRRRWQDRRPPQHQLEREGQEQQERAGTADASASGTGTGTGASPPTSLGSTQSEPPKVFVSISTELWKLVVVYKTLAGLFQVTGGMVGNLAVCFPSALQDLVRVFEFVNLDIPVLVKGVDCLHRYDLFDSLLTLTAGPVAVVAAVTLLHAGIAAMRGRRPAGELAWDWRRQALGVALFVSFAVLPAASARVFSVLRGCDAFESDPPSAYLQADYSIRCDAGGEARYDFWVGYAYVMTVLFVLGIPATYLALLCRVRHKLNPVAAPKKWTPPQRSDTDSDAVHRWKTALSWVDSVQDRLHLRRAADEPRAVLQRRLDDPDVESLVFLFEGVFRYATCGVCTGPSACTSTLAVVCSFDSHNDLMSVPVTTRCCPAQCAAGYRPSCW